jgi:AcrR family transcriptional regulator
MKRTEELARARALGSTKRIVEAAIELASESGGASFTLQQVVDRAGVALQTFYRHFGSKDELMLAVVEEASRAESARIETRAARETDPLDRLRVIVMMPFHTASRSVAGSLGATVSRELRRLREDYAEELAPLTAPYLALLEDAIKQVAATGAISPDDPHRDADLILGLVGAVFRDVAAGTLGTDPDTEEAYLWRFCLRALGANAALLADAATAPSSTSS